MSATSTMPASGQLRALLISLCAALALVVAGNSALAIALPDIAADLGADQSELTWVIDAYALTFAALLLPAGIAADRVGRRTVIVAGLVVFGGAGVASAFATDPTTLIALRAVAGVGAAAVFPVTLSALVDAYPEERRGVAVAAWSAVSAAGAVAGTLVAGALLEVFWWGSIQLVFGVAALLLVLPALRYVAQRRNPSLSLDPIGAVLAVIALTGIVFGVVEAPSAGWTAPEVILPLLGGLLAVVAFVVHELRSAEPSLDVRLFRDRGLATGSVIVALQFFASLGLFVLAPQYLQIVREYSPVGAAAALLVIPVGVGLGTAVAPRWLAASGARWPGAAGLGIMAVGFAGLAVGTGEASLVLQAAGLLVFGVGFGLAVTPGTVLILEGLPAERRSVASAVNDLTREVGGVLGIAVLSSALLAAYRGSLTESLPPGLPDAAVEAAGDGAGAALGLAEGLGPAGAGLVTAAQSAFTDGFAMALWVAAGVLAVAAVGCAVLGPRRPAAAAVGAESDEPAVVPSTGG